jgi:hypothetical protein
MTALPRRTAVVLLVLAAVTVTPAALALKRLLPSGTSYATFTRTDTGFTLNRTPYVIVPSLRITDTHNRMVLHRQLPAQGKVLYRLDANGAVQQLWFLTDDEAQRLQ